MNANTLQWVEKAEENYRSMLVLSKDAMDDHFDTICFLAQQSIEKLLKAILIEEETDVPKIHDLQKLLNLIVGKHPELERFRHDFTRLSRLSAAVRCPYESAGKAETDFALEASKNAREVILHIVRFESE